MFAARMACSRTARIWSEWASSGDRVKQCQKISKDLSKGHVTSKEHLMDMGSQAHPHFTRRYKSVSAIARVVNFFLSTGFSSKMMGHRFNVNVLTLKYCPAFLGRVSSLMSVLKLEATQSLYQTTNHYKTNKQNKIMRNKHKPRICLLQVVKWNTVG